MNKEQIAALISIVVSKRFIRSYFVQRGDSYYGIGVLHEFPLIVSQCLWVNNLLHDTVVVVNVGSGQLLCACRFESGRTVDGPEKYGGITNEIVDVDMYGIRWEGCCLNGVPFGCGDMFNEEGLLIYSGFCFNNEFSCFGSFSLNGVKQYTGMLYRGKRCGFGTLFDTKQGIVFRGEWLDDNPACTQSVTPMNSMELVGINSLISSLEVSNNACNSLTVLSLNHLNRLQEINIGNDCFMNVESFQVSLPLLKLLVIGDRSFSTVKEGVKRKRIVSRSFSVLSCPKLESIRLGVFSFADYYSFEITGAPLLRELKIGSVESDSYNFYYCRKLSLMNLSSLVSVYLGDYAFFSVVSVCFQNLPLLNSVLFGVSTCFGDRRTFASAQQSTMLQMKDLPSLKRFESRGWENFCFHSVIDLENIPNLQYFKFMESFLQVSTIKSNDASVLATKIRNCTAGSFVCFTNMYVGKLYITPFQMDNAQEEQQIREEYNIWKNNVHLLYDLAMIHSLEWPSMTVEWLPTCETFSNEGYSLHHLYLGTHTSENYSNYIIKASVQLQDDYPVKDKNYADFPTQGISGKITVEQRILHDGDVNKMRFMPQNPMIVATKTASGLVNVFDTSLFPSAPESNDVTKTLELTGHDKEGYGLDWSPLCKGLLASGSDDYKVCYWDINAQTTPLHTFSDRSCIIEDVNWHPRDENIISAVGDDGYLVLYDIRQSNPSSLIHVHQKECNVIQFNPHEPHLFITASSDSTVALWDQRQTAFPLHILEGHTGAVFSGKWSPFQRSVVATSGLDRRTIIWDLNKIGQEQTEDEAEDGPAELLFIHGGHTSKVNDISWNPNKEWVMATVADDNILHIWKMAESIYDEKKFDVGSLDESLLQ